MNDMSTTLDEGYRRLEATLMENNSVKKENEYLRQKFVLLEKDLAEYQINLVKSEQYSRNGGFEIKVIEQKASENLPEVVNKIGDALGEAISTSDVDACHRVSINVKDKTNIIVQFQRREKRDKVNEKSLKKRLTSDMLELSNDAEEDSPIYINEHLRPTMNRLLGTATASKREHKWH